MSAHRVTAPGPAFGALSGIARAAEVTLVVGVSERLERGVGRGTRYNTLLPLGPDGWLVNYHWKLVRTYTERLVWGTGDADGARRGARVLGALDAARPPDAARGGGEHPRRGPATTHEMHRVARRHDPFEGRCFVLAAGALMRASALSAELDPHPPGALRVPPAPGGPALGERGLTGTGVRHRSALVRALVGALAARPLRTADPSPRRHA